MGKYCEVCNKGVMSGNLVSHSNRKTKRGWAPNIQGVHVVVGGVLGEFGEVEQGDRPPGDVDRGSSAHDITLTMKSAGRTTARP